MVCTNDDYKNYCFLETRVLFHPTFIKKEKEKKNDDYDCYINNYNNSSHSSNKRCYEEYLGLVELKLNW